MKYYYFIFDNKVILNFERVETQDLKYIFKLTKLRFVT